MSWYESIKKPSWAPAEIAFGRIWGILYPIIFAANLWVLMLVSTGKITWKVALPFWLNLVFNFLFTPLQFGLRNNLLALIDIVLILATGIWAMIAIWPHNRVITFMFLPYVIWVSIATVLQGSITWLNR